MCLLGFCAPQHDKFTGDFRSGAKRTGADPAARKLLGNEAHHQLAKPQPAKLFGDAHAKGAEFRHVLHGLIRDEVIRQMPLVGIGDDLAIGEATILLANGVEIVVVEGLAWPLPFGEARGNLGPQGSRVGIEEVERCGSQNLCRVAKPQVLRTEDLVLPHRQAADELGKGFGEGQPGDSFIQRR